MSFSSLFLCELFSSAAQQETMETGDVIYRAIDGKHPCSSCYTAYYLIRVCQESTIYTKVYCTHAKTLHWLNHWNMKGRFTQTLTNIWAAESAMEQITTGLSLQLVQPGPYKSPANCLLSFKRGWHPYRCLCEAEINHTVCREWTSFSLLSANSCIHTIVCGHSLAQRMM